MRSPLLIIYLFVFYNKELIKENLPNKKFNWTALQRWVHVYPAAVFYSSPQGPRFRWQGTCCPTPRSVQWQSLGPQKPSSSVSNKSVWSCWRYGVDCVNRTAASDFWVIFCMTKYTFKTLNFMNDTLSVHICSQCVNRASIVVLTEKKKKRFSSRRRESCPRLYNQTRSKPFLELPDERGNLHYMPISMHKHQPDLLTSWSGMLWTDKAESCWCDLLICWCYMGDTSAYSWYCVSSTSLSYYFSFITLKKKSDYASSNVLSNLAGEAEHELLHRNNVIWMCSLLRAAIHKTLWFYLNPRLM